MKIELCDSIIKQQRGGYLQESEAKHEREKVIGDLYSKRYAVYANTSVQNYILPLYGKLPMGQLRKNHIKRIYKKAYIQYPSVAKILKTVLTTSLKYAFRHGYVEEDYVTGLKWSKEIKKT